LVSCLLDELRDKIERLSSAEGTAIDNPKGLREVTVTEANLLEFGPTPLPA
jgi:hypothetical protein